MDKLHERTSLETLPLSQQLIFNRLNMTRLAASRRLFATSSLRLAPHVRTPRCFVKSTALTAASPAPKCAAPLFQRRLATTRASVDELIEDIQDQYATAKDEFEIAQEETEKMTVYAEDDRKAAREELDKLQEMYNNALEGPDGEEIKRRIGQRIRELDNAVKVMEEMAMNQD